MLPLENNNFTLSIRKSSVFYLIYVVFHVYVECTCWVIVLTEVNTHIIDNHNDCRIRTILPIINGIGEGTITPPMSNMTALV